MDKGKKVQVVLITSRLKCVSQATFFPSVAYTILIYITFKDFGNEHTSEKC